MPHSDTTRAIEAVWRIESARLIGGLARIVRDVGLAEELAQDALVAALEQWPESGVPDNPGAWLMATAKHRAIDRLRRSEVLERKQQELGRSSRFARRLLRPIGTPPSTTSATMSCGSSSPPATPCSRARRGSRHAAPARRPDDDRDRAGLPRLRADRRPAHSAREAHALRRHAFPSRSRGVTSWPSGSRRCSRSCTSSSTRAIPRRRATTGSARTSLTRRCSGASWCRACSGRAGGAGPGCADGDPGVADRARVGPSGRPVLLLDQDRSRWDYVLVGRGWPRSRVPRSSAAGSDCMRCRPRSRPATRAPACPRTRTGRASWRSTTRSPSWPCLRSWTSTVPSRWAWPSGRSSRSRSSTGSPGRRRRGLPPAPERARRSALQARAARGGAVRVRARRIAHRQRARAQAATRAGGRLRRQRPLTPIARPDRPARRRRAPRGPRAVRARAHARSSRQARRRPPPHPRRRATS